MINLLELFGGIGACTKALERLGIEYNVVDYVEIDRFAVASYNAMHETNYTPQDVSKWDKNLNIDLIMHGSPCQDFSISGNNAGGDEGSGTRSSLMYETVRIVEKLKPKYVIWENVKNLLSKKHIHNFENYINKMSDLGYNSYYQVLNAKDYGIPQNRERVFTISIRKDINKTFLFPPKQELKLRLKDMIEESADEKFYLNDAQCKLIQAQLNNKSTLLIDNSQAKREGKPREFEPKILIKNATKKGYLEAYDGDSINLQRINSKTRRGRVGKEVAQTLDTQCEQAVVIKRQDQNINEDKKIKVIGNYSPSGHDASRIVDDKGIAPTVKENHGTVTAVANNLRIRKLTPKECWRLMGFDDSDFIKASNVNSNTQLYKQAGNSIVVNVLEAILKNLLIDSDNENELLKMEVLKDTETNAEMQQYTVFDYI